MLHELTEQLADLLTEATVKLRIDTKAVDDLVDQEVDETLSFSKKRGGEYTDKQAAADKKHYKAVIKKNMQQRAKELVQAVNRLPVWQGSKLTVEAHPLWSSSSRKRSFWSDDFEPTGDCYVKVYQGGSDRDAPSFAYYDNKMVDDVLDAGDSDFFRDSKVEADYFALVQELRHPGKAKAEGEKKVVLYTARPAKDRDVYMKAKTVPANIFLTTSYREAEGYTVEFGGDRDIWQVAIKKKNLLITLDTPGLKNYQAYAPGGKVPIESIRLFSAA
jgi:hypothetical protein